QDDAALRPPRRAARAVVGPRPDQVGQRQSECREATDPQDFAAGEAVAKARGEAGGQGEQDEAAPRGGGARRGGGSPLDYARRYRDGEAEIGGHPQCACSSTST